MASHEDLQRAQDLLDQLLGQIATRKPDAEILGRFAGNRRADLLRARRLIDQQLQPSLPQLPIQVADGGLPLRDWLADELGVDHDRAKRLVSFIDEYGATVPPGSKPPTIPEFAALTDQSLATVNRRLADFRKIFPGERDPGRIAQLLRHALDDLSLWGSIDESLEAQIGDVPVVPTSPLHTSRPDG